MVAGAVANVAAQPEGRGRVMMLLLRIARRPVRLRIAGRIWGIIGGVGCLPPAVRTAALGLHGLSVEVRRRLVRRGLFAQGDQLKVAEFFIGKVRPPRFATEGQLFGTVRDGLCSEAQR